MTQPTRNINYGNMLYELLRNYYSVNKAGQITWLYKFCLACIAVMQPPFDIYYTARVINLLVAQCAWQMGQLTNVLNYLFDNPRNGIYITQSVSLAPQLPVFGEVTDVNIPEFGGVSPDSFRVFGDRPAMTGLIFNVPDDLTAEAIAALTAVIAQIALTGIPYSIVLYTY